MNNGFMYNLTNPAFTDDICMTNMCYMFPTNIDPLTGMAPMYMNGINLYPGQPLADSFVTPKQRYEKGVIKAVLGGIVLTGLSIFGYKKGSAFVKKIFSNITTPFKNIWNGIKSLFKHNTP